LPFFKEAIFSSFSWSENRRAGQVIDAKSRDILAQRLSLTLGPSPSKGMPLGFALIEDSCGLP
ncbi:hypothetical protein, partial [Azospira restricta]|uniref:hypothetical protein n=1 Tax=Azospira restricta TaxID=404405 RepID=UPI00361D650C